jgi:hypothetical protein
MRLLFAVLLFLIVLIIAVCLIHINPRLENYIQLDDVTPLSKVRDELKTGDVLVFMGTTIKSAAVRTYLQCPASHVGIIIRMDKKKEDGTPVFPDAKSDLYVLDMGGRNIPLVKNIFGRSGRSSRDVLLRTLEKTIKNSRSSYIYGIVPVEKEIDIRPEDVKEYFNCEFNWSPLSMFSIAYQNTKFKVCSTFAAKIHEDFNVQLAGTEKQPHEMTPADYFHAEGIYFVDTTM